MLVFLSAVLSVTSRAGACSKKNPFLSYIELRGVTVYASPRTYDGNKCGKEWTSGDLCCDPESAVSFANKQAIKIATSVDNVNREFNVFINFLKAVNTTLFEMAALKKYDWKPLVKDARERSELETLIENLYSKTTTRSIFFSFSSPGIHKTFADKNKICWDKMTKLRQSAVCSICSGRSEQFFQKDKANMEQEVCNTLIDDCWDFFRIVDRYLGNLAMIEFLWVMANRSKQRYYVVTNPSIFEAQKAMDFIKTFSDAKVDHYGLKDLFAKGAKLSEEQVRKKDAQSKVLCERFVSLHKTPWIIHLDYMIKYGDIKAYPTPFMTNIIDTAKAKMGQAKFAEVVNSIGERGWKYNVNKKIYSDDFEEDARLLQTSLTTPSYQLNGRTSIDDQKSSQRKTPKAFLISANREKSRRLDGKSLSSLELFEADVRIISHPDDLSSSISFSNDAISADKTHRYKSMNLSLAFP